MKRTLGWFQLCCLGIGAIIGAGIFVITGKPPLHLHTSASCVHAWSYRLS
jgi:hypothetical protein